MSIEAVVTTGIYCRPDCSASPNPTNVRTFALPAAAEAAGYRACLRCRPYRTEQPTDGIGPQLVCRAIRMIVDGALDQGNEADLARKLGVSARHLRRIFVDHAGCTPDQLARSRRTHFARRLLDDTDLAITDIAFAAGFGSIRQLNRACVEIFQANPTELRSRRRVSDRLAADGGLTLRLTFSPPLDWQTMLGYLAERAIRGIEHTEDGAYRRTIRVAANSAAEAGAPSPSETADDPGVLEIFPGGHDHLRLQAHLPHWSGLIHVVQQARRIFNLDAELTAATHHLTHDPILAPLLRKRPGLRVPGTWDPYEIGVRAIIGQQVSVTGASTLAGRVVERVGTPVPGLEPMGLTRLFPTPSTLATADLDGLGLPTTRVEAIKSFARAVADGDLPLDRSVELDEMEAALVEVPGIGPWTAQYLAMRMGEPDAFPATDLGLRRAAAGLGTNGSSNGEIPKTVAPLAEQWRPHRSHAAIHLWQSL